MATANNRPAKKRKVRAVPNWGIVNNTVEMYQQATKRTNGVHLPRNLAAAFNLGHRQANDKWRDHTQEGYRHGKQYQNNDERTKRERGFRPKDSCCRPCYYGTRDERDQSAEESRPNYDLQQHVNSWQPISQTTAQEVTNRQVEQHQADDIRPDQIAIAEYITQQSRG